MGMFTFAELCELIRIVSETRIGGLEIEKDGERLRVDGVPASPQLDPRLGAPLLPPQFAAASQMSSGPALPGGDAAARVAHAAVAPAEDDGLSFVTSPIVGTFYAAPSPDAEPYVKIGDFVQKGQVLCIVEAMKLMNEIEADVSGLVVRRFPENAQPVEFGERLFGIRPS
ncbi:MAG TPA: acetyl-CoA carboxylase biotin carboxyl carrier protein [Thermoanaerobaculaceae bacterium]|nr:acetyl-CoA carboxylase biotin carboxyl carrier protein [Thermoanaerobaculaceae bacterium]